MVLPGRSLDICGCSKVSDNGICALSRNCHRLELLDLTSTGVGHKRLAILYILLQFELVLRTNMTKNLTKNQVFT